MPMLIMPIAIPHPIPTASPEPKSPAVICLHISFHISITRFRALGLLAGSPKPEDSPLVVPGTVCYPVCWPRSWPVTVEVTILKQMCNKGDPQRM